MPTYTIHYEYGTYSGERTVNADDEEEAIAKMWAQMRRRGELGLSMAYTSAKVVAAAEITDAGPEVR